MWRGESDTPMTQLKPIVAGVFFLSVAGPLWYYANNCSQHPPTLPAGRISDATKNELLKELHQLVLGGDPLTCEKPSIAIRGAPGGEATISLGEETSSDRFLHRQEETTTTVPDPCPRFPCAPGGKSTIELSSELKASAESDMSSGRVAPGGPSSIVLGGEGPSDVLANVTRGPVGGETTILLGEITDAECSMHCETDETLGVEVPDPAPWFSCAPDSHATINLTTENLPPSDEPPRIGRTAPGGTSSVVLGGDMLLGEMRPVTNGRTPGGNATVVLSSDAPAHRFSHRETAQPLQAFDPTPRFPCAPGGNSTVVLGNGEDMKRSSLTDKVTRAAKIVDENINTANLPQTSNSDESEIQTPSKVLESSPIVLG